MIPSLDRIAFAPILGRPRLRMPGGARVAVWVCPNVEHYEFDPGPVRVRDPWPRTPHPDVLGYAQKDYGNRVGLWRMLEVLDAHGVRCTVSLNLANWEHYPDIFAACEARRWDVMCHGLYNTRYVWGFDEAEERAFVRECVATFRRLTGRQLAGWFSPAASHTLATPDLVAEAGIKYFADYFHDDQPTPLRVRAGRLISVPYQIDLNDAVIWAEGGEAGDFSRMAVDMFDTLYAEGTDQPRVMCLALHPWMMGRPHRARHLDRALAHIRAHPDVWWATGEEIADWFYADGYDAAARAAGLAA